MNKKILLSLSVIGIAAAIAIGGTIAYFSDTETSTGNTFTAGSIDLKVDSTQHYNNMVCVCNTPVCTWQPEAGAVAPFYPAQGTPCGGTWGQPDGKDIVNEKFFNFGDVKPGDSGENTVSLHVVNNDAYICGYITNLANNDNGINEPESSVDSTDGVGKGELQDHILMTVWKDKGSALAPAGACNNILDPNEQVYVSGVPIDSNTGGWLLGHVEGDKTVCLGVKWEIPTTVGNVIQTDSVTGDISFYTEQYRNNPNFTCPTSLPGGTTPAPAPVVDGVISAGEWNGCTDINFDSAKGTACVIAYPDYMYVKYQINDPTDDRSNENSVGNDQLGLNINPSGLPGSWGKPYDIVLQTGTDPAAFTTPVPDVAGSSGLTDGWESEWVTNATWGTLPVDVQTATPYYGATDLRISEWRLPLSSIAGLSSGSPLLVGGAVDIGDGNSYVYPVGLDWNVNATWATVTVK